MSTRVSRYDLAKDKDIRGGTWRVLAVIERHLEYGNWVTISQKFIGDQLGIRKSAVSREIRVLMEKGVLLRDTRPGHSRGYRVSPFYAWRGDTKSHKKAIEEMLASKRGEP